MRKYFLLLLVLVLFLSLCSFVDPDTIDVYTGTIRYVSSDYGAPELSGTITYYLDNYEDVCLTSGGGLFNGSNGSYYGTAIIGGTEYNIRFSPRSELEIQQTFTYNNYSRTEWVHYILYPDIVPNQFELPQISIIFCLIGVLIGSSIIIFKVFL